MKKQRINSILLFAFFGSILLISGCAGSSVQIIKVDIAPRPDFVVYVMPFELPEMIGVAQDWRKTGEVVDTKDGETIEVGMYQYSFGEGDITILRQSLVESLKECRAFQDVIYLREGDMPSSAQPAYYIYTKINETYMESKMTSVCKIIGSIEIKDIDDQTLFTKDINVDTSSLWTIGDAKDSAISEFVGDVVKSFNEFR